MDSSAVVRLCKGNAEAFEWIQIGRIYCHEIDDLIDEDVPKANRISAAQRACRIGALALQLYTHPFFLKNMPALRAAMMLNTSNYLDSVEWEEASSEWQRHFSDWARHGWVQVVLVVAEICGGYENMRNESQELTTMAYANHHNQDKPV